MKIKEINVSLQPIFNLVTKMSDLMRNYEITFIVDPVLSDDEIKSTAQTFVDQLKGEGCNIVHTNEIGLQQLAYPIKKRNSGVYYCVEFETETGVVIDKVELSLRRDERIIRFLSVSLDKYGVKYNDDKRNGLIGKVKKKEKPKEETSDKRSNRPARKQAPVAATPKKVEKKAEAKPVVEEKVKAAAPVETPTPDDFKKIEGIGPKIAGLITDAGIITFAQLAETPAEKIKEILSAAGSRYATHNPTTWPKQAKMAADGDWDALKKWQDELDGGKEAKSGEEE